MAAEYDESDAEEAPPPKPRRPRRPVDWPLMVMLIGALVFLLAFGAVTVLAPRRPFLLVRAGQAALGGAAKPVVTTVGSPPAGTPAAPAAAPAGSVVPAKP